MNKRNKLDERNNRTKQIKDLTPRALWDLLQELCWRSLDRRNCPRFSWEAAPHHWPSVRGGILLSSHGTLNPQQLPFELPEQQQGALETWESQSCKHGLVLDPPPWFAWKLHVAQGNRGFAVRCDLGRKTCHSVWLRRSKGYDNLFDAHDRHRQKKKQKRCLLTACSEDVWDLPSQALPVTCVFESSVGRITQSTAEKIRDLELRTKCQGKWNDRRERKDVKCVVD